MEYKAVASLVEENMKTIFAYALHRVPHREEAEDLAEDIITAILQSAPALRNEDAFFGWFWKIASNTTGKYLYKKGRIPAVVDVDTLEHSISDCTDVISDIIRSEEISLLRRELALLSKEYRECTVAYYFDNLSCREISRKLDISVEMVKYYLYKTRRILKEGMTMTREYGVKSYKPATFHFHTIFSGSFNREYRSLFDRKLPGNILYCAYYTPMTVGELSVELGVASVYLEDEIELLKRYNLLTEVGNGRVQTKLCIFTEAYDTEFRRAVEERFTARLGGILASVKAKLPAIRVLNFPGCAMDDNRLLWALYFKLIIEGSGHWKNSYEIDYPYDIYDNAKGVNFAVDYDDFAEDYSANAFAGYYGLNEKTAACMANFGVLGDKNALDSKHNWARINELVKQSVNGDENAPLAYFTLTQVDRIYGTILADEVVSLGEFYRDLTECAAQIMRNHVSKTIAGDVEAVLRSTIFHRTVGLMGKLAVDSGELRVPGSEDDLPTAVFLFATENLGQGMKGNCCN